MAVDCKKERRTHDAHRWRIIHMIDNVAGTDREGQVVAMFAGSATTTSGISSRATTRSRKVGRSKSPGPAKTQIEIELGRPGTVIARQQGLTRKRVRVQESVGGSNDAWTGPASNRGPGIQDAAVQIIAAGRDIERKARSRGHKRGKLHFPRRHDGAAQEHPVGDIERRPAPFLREVVLIDRF